MGIFEKKEGTVSYYSGTTGVNQNASHWYLREQSEL